MRIDVMAFAGSSEWASVAAGATRSAGSLQPGRPNVPGRVSGEIRGTATDLVAGDVTPSDRAVEPYVRGRGRVQGGGGAGLPDEPRNEEEIS